MSTQPGYGPPSYPPQQDSSSTIIWVVILVLVLVVGLPILAVAVLFLGCCGVFGFTMYSVSQIPAEMVKQQYNDHPVIQQHIGNVDSASLNFAATREEQQKGQQPPGTSIMVIDIRGSKGSGQIIGEQSPGAQPGGKLFSKATLRTKQGEFQLAP